jgi:hypothetical protein
MRMLAGFAMLGIGVLVVGATSYAVAALGGDETAALWASTFVIAYLIYKFTN